MCEAALAVPAYPASPGASRNGATCRQSRSHRTVCRQTRGRELKFWVSCHLRIATLAQDAEATVYAKKVRRSRARVGCIVRRPEVGSVIRYHLQPPARANLHGRIVASRAAAVPVK